MNHLRPKLWATMSTGQRIAVVAVCLVALGLGIILFFYPEGELLQFDIGLVDIDISWRRAPAWLMVTELGAIALLLAIWWKHRKRN
jgi:hypothetical protein